PAGSRRRAPPIRDWSRCATWRSTPATSTSSSCGRFSIPCRSPGGCRGAPAPRGRSPRSPWRPTGRSATRSWPGGRRRAAAAAARSASPAPKESDSAGSTWMPRAWISAPCGGSPRRCGCTARWPPRGLYADVTADSLSFDGLRGSFPGLPLRGAVSGPVRLAGPLTALETHLRLRSPGGAVAVDGTLRLDLPRFGARDLGLAARDLDLERWLPGAPASRLTFAVRGSVTADSGAPPVGALAATLGPSLVAGSALDSGTARVRFADRRLYLDSLRIAQPGLVTTGAGSLGLAAGASGRLALDFDADSLVVLDSLAAWLAGGPAGLAGSARAALALDGALDSLGLDAR